MQDWMRIPGNTTILHAVGDMTIQSADNIHGRDGIPHFDIHRTAAYLAVSDLIHQCLLSVLYPCYLGHCQMVSLNKG